MCFRWASVTNAAAISFGDQLHFCGDVAGLQLYNGRNSAGFEEQIYGLLGSLSGNLKEKWFVFQMS